MSELTDTFKAAIELKAAQSEDLGHTRDELLKFYQLVEASLRYPESLGDNRSTGISVVLERTSAVWITKSQSCRSYSTR